MTNQQIIDTLSFYNCPCEITQTRTAAAFTDYFLAPLNGTTINKLQARVADFSLVIGAACQVVVENACLLLRVASKNRVFYDYFSYSDYIPNEAGALAIGVSPAGGLVFDNLFSMPHLLAAGSTGSGKSVFVHSAIISLARRGCCFRLVDLKRVELSIYNGCGFMGSDCITDAEKAAVALAEECAEMDNRYKLMERQRVNHYSQLKKPLLARVVVIDELADLMLNKATRKSVENSIIRIAQLGRAAGVHLILATQRPSREVITGLIKANIPARIAFTCASAIDARVIGVNGAERLTGKGDAIYCATGKEPQRVQAFGFLSHTPREFAQMVRQSQPQTIRRRLSRFRGLLA